MGHAITASPAGVGWLAASRTAPNVKMTSPTRRTRRFASPVAVVLIREAPLVAHRPRPDSLRDLVEAQSLARDGTSPRPLLDVPPARHRRAAPAANPAAPRPRLTPLPPP